MKGRLSFTFSGLIVNFVFNRKLKNLGEINLNVNSEKVYFEVHGVLD